MKISKITSSEFESNSISSLPIRPNESSRYGKAALSGEELKNMFDKNTELLKNRINSLIDYISGEGERGIASEITTGLSDMPTLLDLCKGILDGSLAATLTLTEEYTLLDFATKLMHFVSPEKAVEFIKIEKKDGAYTLPNGPYENHESAIYLLPSSDSLSVFDCYIWQDGWEIWSTGSLQACIHDLESKVNELYKTAARVSELNYIKSIKADDIEIITLKKKIDAMCAGSPTVFLGSLSDLRNSQLVKPDRIYLLRGSDEYDGYWCYHNGNSWVTGGRYYADTAAANEVQKYDDSPVSASAVKEYVDRQLSDALDGIARNYSGSLNLFDKNAISKGYIDSSGNLIYDEAYVTTDYLDITAIFDLYVSCTDSSGYRRDFGPRGYILYNYDKTPITNSYIFFNTVTQPAHISISRSLYPNARKMRMSFSLSDYNAVTKVTVAEGSTMKLHHPYVRYLPKIDTAMDKESSLPVTNAAICDYVEEKTHSVKWVFGDNAGYPVFDTQNNKLIFNRDGNECEWGVILDGNHYRFESGVPLEIDISPAATKDENGSESDRGVIYLNTALMKSYASQGQSNFANCFFARDIDFRTEDGNSLPVATFKRGENGFCAWIDCPFYIDGKLFGVCGSNDELESDFTEIRSALNEMQFTIEENSTYVADLIERCNVHDQDLAAHESLISELKDAQEELDTKIGGFSADIEEAKSTASDAQSAVINLSDTYFINSYVGRTHVVSGYSLYVSNLKSVCSFKKFEYSSYSNEYVAYVNFSEEVMYNYQLDVSLHLPPCSETPSVYMYDAYGSDLNIVYTGDDCANGVFSPQANTEYMLKIWFQNERYRAHVIALRV